METCFIDDKLLNQRLDELSDVLMGQGRASDPAVILADEARIFLRQAIAITPPKTKAQGEGAVKHDLHKIFTPVEDEFALVIAAEFGTSNVEHWLTNGATLERYEVNWGTLDVHGFGMDAYHQSQRNSAGRTVGRVSHKVKGKWSAKYVVSDSAFAAYAKKVMAKVGMMKSGWLRAYYEFGGKLPAWIQRHAQRSLGGVTNGLGTVGHPSITMSNHAPGIMSQERIIRETIKIRVRAIGRRLKLLASGYNKDIAQGMRVTSKARRTEVA